MITFGRYNIITNAHLDTVKTILNISEKLIIGVLTPESSQIYIDPAHKNFYEECDKNHKMSIRLFNNTQIIEMWEKILETENLSHRVDVVKIKRPEYFPDEFNEQFPKQNHTLVFPDLNEGENSFDTIRNEKFKQILNREVILVKPTIKIHTSSIINRNNKIDYKKYVPNTIWNALKSKGW